MTNDRLRALYALVLARPARALRAMPVSIERILALVERRGGIEARLATLDDMMRDRNHMIELDVLRAAFGVRRRTWWLSPAGYAVAAGLLVAIGLSPLVVARVRHEDMMRGAPAPVVQLLTPTEHVADARITFSWIAVGGARDYEIEILDADGLSMFVSTVNGTSVKLPSTVRLLPGAEYRWWVVARRSDGSRIGAVPRRLKIEDGRGGGGSARTGPVGPTVVLS